MYIKNNYINIYELEQYIKKNDLDYEKMLEYSKKFGKRVEAKIKELII
jgi:hypothetical protein